MLQFGIYFFLSVNTISQTVYSIIIAHVTNFCTVLISVGSTVDKNIKDPTGCSMLDVTHVHIYIHD